MHALEKGTGGGDKVKMYGWTFADTPGELAMVHKSALRVDDTYQRDAKTNRVLSLASQWSWVSCGALTVAKRGDGSLWVVDGQHRLLAAQRRSDITALPCVVFAVSEVKDEARNFATANTMRGAMKGVEMFKARLVAMDPIALAVNELITASGRKVGGFSSQNHVNCVGLLCKLAKDNGAVLHAAWPVIVDVCHGNVLNSRIVEAICFVESRLPEGESLSDPRWRSRLIHAGYDELCASMTRFSAAFARGGARPWAVGLVAALNKGLRQKLVVKGLGQEEAA